MNPQLQAHYQLLCRLKDFDFSKRQRLILELILEKSFGRGRTRAYFARLEYFEALTGMSRGNVSSTLGWLIRAKVIEESPAGVYAVRVPVELWAVPLRLQASSWVQELDKWLDLDPAQMDLIPEPPSLSQALRENFPTLCRESVQGTAGVGAAQRYVAPPPVVQRPAMGSGPVPESGMADGNPLKTGGFGVVPESGTLLKALKVHSLKPSEEALNSELSALKEGEYEGKPTGSRIGNEAEWMARVTDLVGSKTVERYGGWYRNRLRENLSKFERVCNAVALDKRERLAEIGNLGGHFYDLWRRFAD